MWRSLSKSCRLEGHFLWRFDSSQVRFAFSSALCSLFALLSFFPFLSVAAFAFVHQLSDGLKLNQLHLKFQSVIILFQQNHCHKLRHSWANRPITPHQPQPANQRLRNAPASYACHLAFPAHKTTHRPDGEKTVTMGTVVSGSLVIDFLGRQNFQMMFFRILILICVCKIQQNSDSCHFLAVYGHSHSVTFWHDPRRFKFASACLVWV